MSYRDEREALRERAASLEEDLRASAGEASRATALEAELRRKERENENLRARLAKLQDPERGPRLARILGAILLFILVVVGVIWGALQLVLEPETRPHPIDTPVPIAPPSSS